MATSDIQNYLDILRTFDNAMLVTRNGNQLRSRPMAIADVEDDGSVWFLTSVDSGKLAEITEHPDANVALQDGQRFLSISGKTMCTRDRSRRKELWSPAYSVWFPEGVEDPSLTVLAIQPTMAEYWDNSGINGMQVLFELGKSLVTDEQPQFDDAVHRKVDFH